VHDVSLVGWDEGAAPRVEPLAYPGRRPPQSILLTDDRPLALRLLAGRRLGQAWVEAAAGALPGDDRRARERLPLDDVLLRRDSARTDDRVPVLAVGSNASPAQLRHKYEAAGVSLVTPMVACRVEGLAAGLAAIVSRVGYVPATPVLGADLVDDLFVQWLDPAQLARLDATEPNYRRVVVGGDPATGGVRITLPSGEVLGACHVYACTRGSLALGRGDDAPPLRLGDQATLLAQLLAASPRLRELMGPTPAAWIVRATAPGVADAAHETFLAEGWVRREIAAGSAA
jgi:hypothetical protein